MSASGPASVVHSLPALAGGATISCGPRPKPRDRARRRGGFTLLEVLLAVAIGGSLLTAVIAFAFSMSELWGNGSEARLFDQHVRGVTRFLENVLRDAQTPPPEPGDATSSQAAAANAQQTTPTPPPTAATGSGNTGTAETPVAWRRVRGREFGTEEFLAFELPESPGIFAWPEQSLPFVVCWLRLDPGRGLFLLWKSRLEIDFEDETPRELLLSAYVTGIKYFYYDTTGRQPRWEETDRPRTSSGGVRDRPARVRLAFTYGGFEQSADLLLPTTPAAVPLY